MSDPFPINVTDGADRGPMKEKEIHYPFRFKSTQKYMYVSRIAFFSQKSINEVLDSMIFGRGWQEKDDELRVKQTKLGVTDKEIQSRRRKRLRRWRLRRAA